MIEITRKFEVPISHRLLNHEGTCRFIHGHNYVFEITLASDRLDGQDRILDFSTFKKGVIGSWLEENWDHGMLANEYDDEVINLHKGSDAFFKKLYLFKGNPTAELMAKELYVVVSGLLSKDDAELLVKKIRVWETSSCYSDYSPEGDFSGVSDTEV